NPLLASDRVLELDGADLRSEGLRGADEDEGGAAFDGRADLLQPLGRWRNALPIDPRFALALGQGCGKALREGLVLARVGNEDVGHRGPLETSSGAVSAFGATRDICNLRTLPRCGTF